MQPINYSINSSSVSWSFFYASTVSWILRETQVTKMPYCVAVTSFVLLMLVIYIHKVFDYVQELPHQHQSRRAHSKDSHFHNTYAAQHSLFLHPFRRDPVLSKSTAGAVAENEQEKIHSSRNGKWLSIVKHSATELDTHYISDYHITSFFPSYYIL